MAHMKRKFDTSSADYPTAYGTLISRLAPDSDVTVEAYIDIEDETITCTAQRRCHFRYGYPYKQ